MHQLVQKIVIFNPISKYYLKSIWKQGDVVFPVEMLTFGHEQAPNYEGYSLDRIKMTKWIWLKSVNMTEKLKSLIELLPKTWSEQLII